MADVSHIVPFEVRVQRLAEERLNACYEEMDALDSGELGDDPSAWPESEASGPFDGCVTCVVREVLDAVWDEFIAEARREAERGRRSD